MEFDVQFNFGKCAQPDHENDMYRYAHSKMLFMDYFETQKKVKASNSRDTDGGLVREPGGITAGKRNIVG